VVSSIVVPMVGIVLLFLTIFVPFLGLMPDE